MERLCQVSGLPMSHVMHVKHPRRLIQNMIVESGDVDSCGAQLLHHGRDFVLQQNQVPHDHGVVVTSSERRPRSESQSWLNLDARNRDMEIRARKTQAVDIASFLAGA